MPDLFKEKTFSLVELIVEDEDGKKYTVSSDYVNENINYWVDDDDVKLVGNKQFKQGAGNFIV